MPRANWQWGCGGGWWESEDKGYDEGEDEGYLQVKMGVNKGRVGILPK